MTPENLINGGTLVIAVGALVVSGLSWLTSLRSLRASTFDRRFEVYEDVENFIGAWMKHARPDMGKLPTLVSAWNRSHFLCKKEVTAYLRKLWLDAVRVNYLKGQVGAGAKIHDGGAEIDAATAMQRADDLTLTDCDVEKLREVFMPDMKV
jgi:hypothetical protein